MFSKVGSVLANRRYGKSSGAILALEVRRVVLQVIKEECADLPAEILSTIKVKTYKNGVVTIVCPQMVGAELYTRSDGLKKAINRGLGRNLVTTLKFKTL